MGSICGMNQVERTMIFEQNVLFLKKLETKYTSECILIAD